MGLRQFMSCMERRDLMRKRREAGTPLKVIIMSATLSTGLFSEYFGCTVLSASGRTHPVTQVGALACVCLPCMGQAVLHYSLSKKFCCNSGKGTSRRSSTLVKHSPAECPHAINSVFLFDNLMSCMESAMGDHSAKIFEYGFCL